ncbi:hypothetical protein HOLleu_06507 [Holothuria leucospilota]|uniref:Uncharacterized protein n=1 Tax=Holothuria leucospilota TaxID=206669 RepID=A0A9Q1CLL2_HOLLE|nr:hypothetical protein HOLleu_06507 [Holothuria leucospilota]
MECTHQDRGIQERFTDGLMVSEGNKVLFTFETDCSSLGITCVYLCITIKEPPEKIESYIESNDVFVYRSSSNFIEFEAVIRSFFNYSYTHSLKEVEDLHECILYNEAFYESPGLCLSYLVDYGGSREGELSNGDWCMRTIHVAIAAVGTITLEFNVDASDITYISVSRIVKSLEGKV